MIDNSSAYMLFEIFHIQQTLNFTASPQALRSTYTLEVHVFWKYDFMFHDFQL